MAVAANARSIREFDEALTRGWYNVSIKCVYCKMIFFLLILESFSVSFGFKSVDDYYYKASSSKSIEHVRTPLLCIQVNPHACEQLFSFNVNEGVLLFPFAHNSTSSHIDCAFAQ